MSARSRALIPLSAEQQAAMQAVAVTEQRRRQGRTLSAWPYASAFFRCLNGSRRISLTDLRFFAPALTKEEFHGNRLLWLAAVDKLIESFGEVCVLPLPSDAGHRLFPSVPFREGERRRQKTTLTERNTAASGNVRQNDGNWNTRHVLLRRRLTLRFILPPRSEAGCPAGLVLLRSMIWKRFSGGGAGVFHHCHHLTGFSGRRNHSGG